MDARPLPVLCDGEWHRLVVYQKDGRRIVWRDGLELCEICEERPAVMRDRQILHVCRQCAVAESESA